MFSNGWNVGTIIFLSTTRNFKHYNFYLQITRANQKILKVKFFKTFKNKLASIKDRNVNGPRHDVKSIQGFTENIWGFSPLSPPLPQEMGSKSKI